MKEQESEYGTFEKRLEDVQRENKWMARKLYGTLCAYEVISKSRYINEIATRFEPLAHIEEILDNNNLVFRYNEKLNTYSMMH